MENNIQNVLVYVNPVVCPKMAYHYKKIFHSCLCVRIPMAKFTVGLIVLCATQITDCPSQSH